MNKHSWIRTALVVLGLTALTSLNFSQAQQTPPPSPQSSPIEPDAVAALNRMGAYLRTLQRFSIRSETTTDEVTDDGMKLQFGGTVLMQAQSPNRLRVEVDSDRMNRQFIYDGSSLTVYGPLSKYYATVPAPGTIRELIQVVEKKYGINLPLDDLFRWGVDDSVQAAIKEIAVIGPSRIRGALCDHIAARQENVDWQIWIEQGKTPLPRKLVITTKTELSQPQHVTVMQWTLAPKFDDATFRFSPPKDAHRIPLKIADEAPAGK